MSSHRQFKRDLADADRLAPSTAWVVFKWGVLIVVILAALTFLAQSLGIISINLERERIQHSQQYVETKVSQLHKLHNDWQQLETECLELGQSDEAAPIVAAKRAQQKNIVKRMKLEAGRIPQSEVPAAVREFLSNR